MYVPFENISDSSRIWVFQSSRHLVSSEIEYIKKELLGFCQDWSSHGHVLESSYLLQDERFIILAINESVHDASGCSIDKSVHIIKTIEQALGLNLLDKSLVTFVHDGVTKTVKLSELKAEIAEGFLTEQSIVYNTLVSNKAEFLSSFKLPAAETWLKKYFVRSAI